MVSRLLVGDNNLSRFWPAHQFSRPSLKDSVLVTATDLDTLEHALTQVEDRDQVIISMLTSVLLEEANSSEIGSSAYNVCSEVVSRVAGLCPRTPSCQVLLFKIFFFLFPSLVCDRVCPFEYRFSLSYIIFPVFPGSPGEMRVATLVQQLVPGHLRCPGPSGAQVPSQPAPFAALRYRFHHV